MQIRTVGLYDVRNHVATELACAGHVNVLTGRNGSGKTSVLESIGMCAIGRSIVPVPDAALVRHGAESATMIVTANRDLGAPWSVKVTVREGARKRIETSLASNATVRDLIGELPMVALTPDHKAITFGAPADRRAFVDAVMAQASTRYRDLLYELRRVLKQRNAVLAMQADDGTLTTWTAAFTACSAEIIVRRKHFIAELAPRVREAYSMVSDGEEAIDVCYRPDTVPDPADVDTVRQQLDEAAARLRAVELRRGTTMFGPQKDEVDLTINGGLVRETASQGQHKSLLVALKLAECDVLLRTRNERPVVLLDDVFSELDRRRIERVMHGVLTMGMQCFVTTTEGDSIGSMVPPGTDIRTVTLARGQMIDSNQQPWRTT
ncbi:MAG: DNA replication and repair protein RecF [Candidatus Kapabacteria bacterium]|nr:DNA replication and repair protein RecF [Candidatus Kapabacteria bacterium]